MNKTGDGRKMFLSRANAVSLFSRWSAPSHPLLKPLLWGEIASCLWVLGGIPSVSVVIRGFYPQNRGASEGAEVVLDTYM
jgi:hypothetical protein